MENPQGEPRPRSGETGGTAAPVRNPAQRGEGRGVVIGLMTGLALLGAAWLFAKQQRSTKTSPGTGPASRGGSRLAPVPVVAGTVNQKDVPIYLDGLGTVQAFNTVTVRARVDGQLEKVAFTEGQDVHAGDLLAKIDAKPFQTLVEQNKARKAQDEAQLANARLQLKRNSDLLANKILAQQDYDTQKAL